MSSTEECPGFYISAYEAATHGTDCPSNATTRDGGRSFVGCRQVISNRARTRTSAPSCDPQTLGATD